MKTFILVSTCILCSLSAMAQDHSWGVGMRLGAFNQRNTFNEKTQLSDKNSNINSGLYFQAFINKELGKKKSWMIEGNLGYNSYSFENTNYYPSMQQVTIFEYLFTRTNVYSLQVNLRYAFLNVSSLNWKHYAGISIACHNNVTNAHSFYNTHSADPNVIERDKYSYNVYHNFIGAEYFGKIGLNKRLSMQYLFGYNFSIQNLTPNSSYIYEGYTIHRFNVNFGIGYQL